MNKRQILGLGSLGVASLGIGLMGDSFLTLLFEGKASNSWVVGLVAAFLGLGGAYLLAKRDAQTDTVPVAEVADPKRSLIGPYIFIVGCLGMLVAVMYQFMGRSFAEGTFYFSALITAGGFFLTAFPDD